MAIVDYFVRHPRRLIRLDAAGAFISAVSNGLVLPFFTDKLGVPAEMLHTLSGMATAVFIIGFFKGAGDAEPGFLRVLTVLNVSYCVLVLWLTLTHAAAITDLGWLVLGGEVVIVLSLAAIEFAAFRRTRNQGQLA